jgi:beta-lactamase class A
MLTLQIKRTTTANNPPASGALQQGELSVGIADTPTPSLWVGVPTTANPNGVAQVNPVDTALATATGDVTFTITYGP